MSFESVLRDSEQEALRERYRHEVAVRKTERRARAFGGQMRDMGLQDADPYQPRQSREPLSDEVNVLIIGGGFSGILAGAHLRMQGVDKVRIVDRAGDFGGVWYWNRYPGAQCDVESYIYLPLLEETGYMPKERFSHQPEILAYSQLLARHFDLYRDVIFHTEITNLEWQESENRWLVETNRGDSIHARFVVMANGPIDKPKAPAIQGMEDFAGHSFHTSRWDYDYTQGSSNGQLEGLKDKRVGIIGTGATAIQVVPHLAEWSEQLFVFQRTPATVAVRDNTPTDPEWVKSLRPGWQQARIESFLSLVAGQKVDDSIQDAWTYSFKKLFWNKAFEGAASDEIRTISEVLDLELGEEIRARVDEIIEDDELAESLKAYYYYNCKRPGFSDTYLQSFNRSNVTLVDSRGDEIQSITSKGVVVGGHEYEVDCLVFATGFDINSPRTRRAGYDVRGRHGLSLSEKWKDGMSSLHGLMTKDFPNLTFSPGVHSQFAATAVNFTVGMNQAARHTAYIISTSLKNGVEVVDVDPAAEKAWVQTILDRSPRYDPFSRWRLDLLANCVPGWLNNEGHPEALPESDASFGGPPNEFYGILEAWRANNKMDGLVLEHGPSVAVAPAPSSS